MEGLQNLIFFTRGRLYVQARSKGCILLIQNLHITKFTDRTRNFDFRINKSDWLVDINNPSSIASKVTMSVSSTSANIIFKGKPFI